MSEGVKRRRLAPLQTQSLSHLAHESIRDSIVRGTFSPGARLVEARLADELGISRAPIREALHRLIEEGLLIERPRHGVFVRELTARDFVDIYNVRLAIETGAVRLITRHQPPLASIEALIRAMDKAAHQENVSLVVDRELSIHEEFCRLSGNTYFHSMFRSLSGHIRLALALDDAAYANLRDVVAEHPPLLEAIRSGNERRATKALQEHIVASVGAVLERLGGTSGDLLVS
jgi:DNA-binding GntR family transcriptional regulator